MKIERQKAPPSHLAFETALEQGHDVQAKVEECADDLSSANALLKVKVSGGKTAILDEQTLKDGEAIEVKVQECADELTQVTDKLEEGLGELKKVADELGASQDALAESETALVASQRAEKAASWKAMHDVKTGMPNRALFDDRLEQALAGAERHKHSLAVMFFDLNRFKSINDTYGHSAGDAALTAVAERLLRHARQEDTVCRNGGDEFLYLLIKPQGRENVERIARFLLEAIVRPITVGKLSLIITPSIGISLYPDHGTSAEMLIENAGAAMYLAKQRDSSCEVFNSADALIGKSNLAMGPHFES
jgi:diguanylate cyclase (GGDEF)-like protein